MCLSSGSSAPAPAPRPAGAGFTVADVDTDTSKYTKVYDENQKDITSEVVKTPDNKYKKRQTTDAAIDTYAGG
jgi:hypothetical protein